jgi:acyl-CoA synthetase (AMP-forming)/AMP-acid ligase II
VGKKFSGIQWRVIRIVDGPINTIEDAPALRTGEIGELIVAGPVVTREYYENPRANKWGKIAGGDPTRSGRIQGADLCWHRMGDVGYLDAEGRFWYCGRMSHRVQTAQGPLYTEPCEAIFNTHPLVYRSALVGLGKPGKQTPVIILEPHAGQMPTGAARTKFLEEIRELARSNPKTERIEKFLLHPSLPVDIRHNSKIFREKLAKWARWRVW